MKEYIEPEGTYEIVVKIKSTRVKFQKIQDYIPIMSESKYSVAVSQLKYHKALHPDVHIFFMKIQEEQPEVIADIFTQIERMGNLFPQRCALQDEATSFRKQIQTIALERTRKRSNEEFIIIKHIPEAK